MIVHCTVERLFAELQEKGIKTARVEPISTTKWINRRQVTQISLEITAQLDNTVARVTLRVHKTPSRSLIHEMDLIEEKQNELMGKCYQLADEYGISLNRGLLRTEQELPVMGVIK